MDSSAVSALVPRTLKSKLDVFAVLVDLVITRFHIDVDRLELSKPSLGICRSFSSFWIPWPVDLECKVNYAVSHFTSRKPIRWARDLAKAWP